MLTQERGEEFLRQYSWKGREIRSNSWKSGLSGGADSLSILTAKKAELKGQL